jgi:hypothetical protein
MPATHVYSLDDFEEIRSSGFDYALSGETHDLIDALASQVGAADYIRTPVFSTSSTSGKDRDREKPRGGRNRRRMQEISDDDWNSIRAFQTKEKSVDTPRSLIKKEFRDCINRITSGTQDDEEWLERCVTIIGRASTEDCLGDIYDIFGGVVSANSLNSNVCARLYVKLLSPGCLEQHESTKFHEHVCGLWNQWRDSFYDIEEVDEDDDYDKFCANNRMNDIRKTRGKFFGAFLNAVAQEYEATDSEAEAEGSSSSASYWSTLIERLSCEAYDLFVKLETNLCYQDNTYICEQFGIALLELYDQIEDTDSLLCSPENANHSATTIICDIVDNGKAHNPSLSNKLLFKLMDYKSN